MTTAVVEPQATEDTEAVLDISDFVAGLDTFVSADDNADLHSLGTVVREKYRALDRAEKTLARRTVDTRATTAIYAGDILVAQRLVRIKDELVKPAKTTRVRVAPKNHTDAVVSEILAIQLGYSLAVARASADTDLDADWQQKIAALATGEAQVRATEYAAWLDGKREGDEPEGVTEVEKSAARISLGRGPKGQGRKPKVAAEAEAPAGAVPASE